MDSSLKRLVVSTYGQHFALALETTMRFEGGWSNHPSDRGGKTKYGITQKTLRNYNKRMGTWLTIEGLTPEQAADVYWILYWKEMRIDRLPHAVQGLMFDWSVHAGFFSIRSLQRHFKLKPDGVVGPRTRASMDKAIVTWGSEHVLRALAIRRMNHLCRLVRRDRKQGDFIVGWWTRVQHWLK
jgi:lysozyme family protein